MRALTDEWVSVLVPLLEAEEKVLGSLLSSDVLDALRTDHRDIRLLAERLSMLSGNMEANRRPVSDAKPVTRAVREAVAALDSHEVHQRNAFASLEELLTAAEKDLVDDELRAACVAAREHTMLIVQPAIPPTASTVFRHRPDLDAAHAVSLADVDLQSGEAEITGDSNELGRR